MPPTPRPRRASAAPRARTKTKREFSEVDVSISPRPRAGHKRTVLDAVTEIPNFLRLLYGLLVDPRVATVDKLLVAGAVAYVMIPVDIIPDFIPIVGEVDDVFVLVLALRHLMQNAGREVLLDHWMGNPAELDELSLQRVLAASAFFLPRTVRRRLRTIGRV